MNSPPATRQGRTLLFTTPGTSTDDVDKASAKFLFTDKGLSRLGQCNMTLAEAVEMLDTSSAEELKSYVADGILTEKRQKLSLRQAFTPMQGGSAEADEEVEDVFAQWDDVDPQSRHMYEKESPVVVDERLGGEETTHPYLTFPEAIKVLEANPTAAQKAHVQWCLRYMAGKWQNQGEDWGEWLSEGMPTAVELLADARHSWPPRSNFPFSINEAAKRSAGRWMRRVAYRTSSPGALLLTMPESTDKQGDLEDKLDQVLDLVGGLTKVNAPRQRPDTVMGDGGTPPEAHRRRAEGFGRAMSGINKITDSSSPKDIGFWAHNISAQAVLNFGERWTEKQEIANSIIAGAQRAMSNELQVLWQQDTQDDPTRITNTTWSQFIEWVRRQCTHEAVDEAREARQKLASGGCKQRAATITEYLRNFKRLVRLIPSCSEEEQIVFYQLGLNARLAPRCRLDIQGKQFMTLDALHTHARAVETELRETESFRGGGERYGKSRESRFQQKGGYKRKFDGPAPSLAAMPGRGGDRGGRNGGRGGGRGGAGRGDQARSFHPRQDADLKSAFPSQPGISNEQALFLREKNKCYFCFKGIEACTAARTGPGCPKKAEKNALRPDGMPGCPKWK